MFNNIRLIQGYAIDVRVDGGRLKIRDGFPFDGNVLTEYINRGTNLIEHLVILSQNGNLTLDAIAWLIGQNICVSIIGPDGELITSLNPETHISTITKRRQATISNSLQLKLSVWILKQKFIGQRTTLLNLLDTYSSHRWLEGSFIERINKVITSSYRLENSLNTDQSIETLRGIEAQLALGYWSCFESIPLTWGYHPKGIPEHWLTIGQRTSLKSKSPRKAINPFHAGLNYLYAVLETKLKQECLYNGLDPDFGLIHVDKGNRHSLIFDLMEVIRPNVDFILLEWFLNKSLNRKQFFETREGVCRLHPDITKEIIPLLTSLDDDIKQVTREYALFFRNRMVTKKPNEFFEPSSNEGVHSPRRETVKKPKQKKVMEQKEKIVVSKLCLQCQENFIPVRSDQKFCSSSCSNRHRQKRLREKRLAQGVCPMCGKDLPKAVIYGKRESLYCVVCTQVRRDAKRNSRCK